MLKINTSLSVLPGHPERGAAMVESIAVIVSLMFLTGLLIDVSLGLQRYGTLSDSITRVIRTAASTPCTEVTPAKRREIAGDPANLSEQVRNAVAQVTGSPDNLLSISVIDSGFSCDQSLFSPPIDAHSHPVLATRAKVRFQCFFCFIVGGLDVTIASRVPVEDTSAECGYPVSC